MKSRREVWDDRVGIAIMLGVWVLMGAFGLTMEWLEFKLWLSYVM